MGDRATRLVQQQFAQIVVVVAEVLHLLEHGGTGYVPDAAGDDVVDLTAHMAFDEVDHSAEAHRSPPG